jgi:hypothetical protein
LDETRQRRAIRSLIRRANMSIALPISPRPFACFTGASTKCHFSYRSDRLLRCA